MTSQLARDLAAIAHQHYVTPDTLDQGVSGALIERMQERLNGYVKPATEMTIEVSKWEASLGYVPSKWTRKEFEIMHAAFSAGWYRRTGENPDEAFRKAVET